MVRIGFDVNARVSTAEDGPPFNMTGMTALKLAYELVTFPAKNRISHITGHKGVPNKNLMAVIKYLKSMRAPEERQKILERSTWRYRKFKRHTRFMTIDLAKLSRGIFSKIRNNILAKALPKWGYISSF